jgi:hypothetical protein
MHLESYDGIGGIGIDFASIAMASYSFKESEKTDLIDKRQINDLENFDPQKRLEFWEWWLTEAIPQAWELAQQSTNQ